MTELSCLFQRKTALTYLKWPKGKRAYMTILS